MNELKKTLFISDLHLDEADSTSYNQFEQVVAGLDSHVDALFILGDFFEAWIGDDDHSPFNESVIALLKSVREKNIPVYLMHGNRDFLLGKKFLSQTGCTFLTDETSVTIYGAPVLLMHGDTLCVDDHAYQRVRKFLRNKFLQFLFLWLPLSLRRKIANKMRGASKHHTANAPMYVMDVTQEEVARVMRKNNTYFLIHGHTHKPAFHQFTIDNEPYTRIVLGAWHKQASVLVWYENGYKELV
jgi:UDP-2,3-diacylglucosamine hydrolase